jgi:hypothetical protein
VNALKKLSVILGGDLKGKHLLLPAMRRRMKLRAVLLFAFVFVSTLTFSTALNNHGELRTGWHRSSSWGWPKAWLQIHIMDKSYTENGRRVQGAQGIEDWTVGWASLLLSASFAAAVAAATALPLVYLSGRKHRHAT